jgi:hypothetical protein
MPSHSNMSRSLLSCLAAVLLFVAGSAAAVPLRMSVVQNLAFGSFSPNSAGKVTISPAGSRSATGGVFLLSSGAGVPALFLVTGNSSQVYSVSLPNGAIISNGSSSMLLNNFVSTPSGASLSTGLLSGGSQMLRVGATLAVGADQARGDYTGTFSVTIDNN